MIKNIVKLVAIFSLLFVNFSCCSSSKPINSSYNYVSKVKQDRIKYIEDREVALLGRPDQYEGAGKGAICGGTFISSDEILTAFHCVAGVSQHFDSAEELEAYLDIAQHGLFDLVGTHVGFATYSDVNLAGQTTQDHLDGLVKTRREGVVYATDPACDLAIIKTVKYKSKVWAKLAKRNLLIGEHVYTMTMIGGMPYGYQEALVSAYRTINVYQSSKFVKLIQMQSGLWQGASGCGIFDQDGNIQGIMSIALFNRAGLAMAVDKSNVLTANWQLY